MPVMSQCPEQKQSINQSKHKCAALINGKKNLFMVVINTFKFPEKKADCSEKQVSPG